MRRDAEHDGEAERRARRGRSPSHQTAGLPGAPHDEHTDGPERSRLDVPSTAGERDEDDEDDEGDD